MTRTFNTITLVNHTIDEINDPCYNEHSRLFKVARTQALLLQHFTSRWENEYLTLLRREFHRISGNNDCKITVGGIVLVHDDGPHVQWRLAIVEDLIHGGDGLVHATNIRTSTGQTNRPIVRLIQLEE